jgi:hypothetical protein
MDYDIKVKRNKKSDKSKRNKELYGKFSSKHIRQIELKSGNVQTNKIENTKNKK